MELVPVRHFQGTLKGTVSLNGFGVLMVSFKLNKGRDHFLFLSCSNDFIMQKVYFSRLMQDYVGIMLLLLGQQGLGHFFRYWPLLSIG